MLRVREPVVEYKFKPAQSKPRLAAAQTVEHVTKGLPFKEVESLRGQLAEPLETLGRHLSISRSTLQRRRAERRLSPHESDRVARISRLLRHATAVFGDIDRASVVEVSPKRTRRRRAAGLRPYRSWCARS